MSVLTVYATDDSTGRVDQLRTLASNSNTSFAVTSPKTHRNLFHKVAEDRALKRIKAVQEGAATLSIVNQSIILALNAKDKNGKTPLYKAAETAWAGPIAEIFLAMGADPTIKCKGLIPEEKAKQGYMTGDTALVLRNFRLQGSVLECLKEKELKQAHVLIEKGIDLKVTDSLGNNPALVAIKLETSQNEIIKLLRSLVAHGDTINYQNPRKETPLLIAIQKGYEKILDFLLFEAQADTSLKYQADNTILHEAVLTQADREIIKMLLKSTAQEFINTVNKHGKMPLHFPLDSAETLKLFFLHGAKTHCTNDIGEWKPIEDQSGQKITEVYLNRSDRAKFQAILDEHDPTKSFQDKMNSIPEPTSIVGELATGLGGVVKTSVIETGKVIGTAVGRAAGATTQSFLDSLVETREK